MNPLLMKKIHTLVFFFFSTVAVSAQVNVTFQVDVSNYSTEITIAETGMRIGGTFATLAATNQGASMVDWTPSDLTSAMTDEGDGVWSVTVQFPEEQVGEELLFRFVNGDWGNNEGGAGSGIARGSSADCGVDDGFGNINRTFSIPTQDEILQFCYDSCKTCNGENPYLGINQNIAVQWNLSVVPNPTHSATHFCYTLPVRKPVRITLYNMVGTVVRHVVSTTQDAGTYQVGADMTGLENGMYLYRMQIGNVAIHGQLVKQ